MDAKPFSGDPYATARQNMVLRQLETRGIHDKRVLAAMLGTPRHAFVPKNQVRAAYDDCPLPIGSEQTISQPYTVAFMCEALGLTGSERVLEIGTGSGYGAAVLSQLAAEVHSMERIVELADRARATLKRLGYANAHIHTGDGTLGLPKLAPFDAIIATAGAASLPAPYLDELTPDGCIVIPLGDQRRNQTMSRFTRMDGKLQVEHLGGFAFVPLIGRHGWD